MERKTIEKSLLMSIDISEAYEPDRLCINELIDFLNQAKDSEATHVYMDVTSYDNCLDNIILYPLIREIESDEDYNLRMLEESSKKKADENVKKAKEIDIYEKLHEKYGKR